LKEESSSSTRGRTTSLESRLVGRREISTLSKGSRLVSNSLRSVYELVVHFASFEIEI